MWAPHCCAHNVCAWMSNICLPLCMEMHPPIAFCAAFFLDFSIKIQLIGLNSKNVKRTLSHFHDELSLLNCCSTHTHTTENTTNILFLYIFEPVFCLKFALCVRWEIDFAKCFSDNSIEHEPTTDFDIQSIYKICNYKRDTYIQRCDFVCKVGSKESQQKKSWLSIVIKTNL